MSSVENRDSPHFSDDSNEMPGRQLFNDGMARGRLAAIFTRDSPRRLMGRTGSYGPPPVTPVITTARGRPADERFQPLDRRIKAGFDVMVAMALVLLALPILLAIAICVLADGGSPFYTQTRIGQRGRHFLCLKFRTMTVDAEQRLHELLASDPVAAAEWSRTRKLTCDPRITRIGWLLRKTSLDELPQLLNVLNGDMSLVGPRPIVAA